MLMLAQSRILTGLRNGVPTNELQSPIEPMALPIHCFNLALLSGLIITFTITAFNFEGTGLWSRIGSLIILVVSGMLARRYCHPRIAAACEALGVMGLNGYMMVWSLGLLCAINLPLADDLLLKSDAALGFHWRAFSLLFVDQDMIIFWLRKIYASIQWQPMLLIVILCIKHHYKNCWIFVNAWVASLAITIFLFPFFPAKAAFFYFHVPNAKAYVADFYPIMEALRNGSIRTIGAPTMKGMVTFPSFHAASAICLGWGFSKLKWLRWPFLLLNLVMLLATIVIGGHYLVDLIAGVVIACGAIWISQKFAR